MTLKRKHCRLEKILKGNIRLLMIIKKFNQVSLCKEASVDVSNFNMFLNEKRGLPMSNLEKISKVFKIKPEKLFDPFLIVDGSIPNVSMVTGEKRRVWSKHLNI